MLLTVVLTDEQLAEIARQVAALNGPSTAGAPLSVDEACAALSLSRATIRRRIRAGMIRTLPDVGRTLIPRKEIERLQEGRRRAS